MMVSKMMCLRAGLFLPLLLGGTVFGGLWLGLAPRPAIAQTTVNVDLLLEPSEKESFAVFIARSEANAAVRVQSLFDQDLLRTEVRLTVLGQRGVAIAPVMKLRVTRQEWTNYPDPEIWSVYYPETRSLLAFDEFNEADDDTTVAVGNRNRSNSIAPSSVVPDNLDNTVQDMPPQDTSSMDPPAPQTEQVQ